MTRYIYDLSSAGGAGGVSYRGMTLAGYGNLVETEQLLTGTAFAPFPTGVQPTSQLPMSKASWTPVRASSFDALDRQVAAYEAAFGDQPKLQNTYDGTDQFAVSQLGLLTSTSMATGEAKTYAYDADGRKTDIAYSGDNGVTPATHFGFDADGREVLQSTATLGAQTLQYDGAGELTSIVEPASLGSQTVSYQYFEDGLRRNLGYTSSTYSAAPLYAYSYRTDGLRSSLTLPKGKPFQWTYTSAGRLLTQSDPLTGASVNPSACTHDSNGKCIAQYYPTSLTYVPYSVGHDNFGRINSLALPESVFSYPSISSDLEDGTASYQALSKQNPPSQNLIQCIPSNVRNEKPPLPYTQPTGPCAPFSGRPITFNGAAFITKNAAGNGAGRPMAQFPGWTIDARAGVLKQWQITGYSGNIVGSQYGYDLSGRQISDSEETERAGLPGEVSNLPQLVYVSGTRTKSYDAENRIHSQQSSYPNPVSATPTSYGGTLLGGYWGDQGIQPDDLSSVDYSADSHPVRLNWSLRSGTQRTQYSGTLIWLWDGNDRLAEIGPDSSINFTASGGAVSELTFSIEGLGDFDPSTGNIAVNDRGPDGSVVSRHLSQGFTNFSAGGKPRGAYALISSGGPCSIDSGYFCALPQSGKLTADGWTFFNNAWQGVRTFDFSVGQWNTPDAYAGEVHDPASQMPYMWNRNNPYSYNDPSGYCNICDWFKKNVLGKPVASDALKSDRVLNDIYTKTQNIIHDQLTETTLNGAVNELKGEETVINGRSYDHVTKVQQAIRGLNNQVKALNTLIRDKHLKGDDRAVVEDLANQIRGFIHTIQSGFEKEGVANGIDFNSGK